MLLYLKNEAMRMKNERLRMSIYIKMRVWMSLSLKNEVVWMHLYLKKEDIPIHEKSGCVDVLLPKE